MTPEQVIRYYEIVTADALNLIEVGDYEAAHEVLKKWAFVDLPENHRTEVALEYLTEITNLKIDDRAKELSNELEEGD